MEQVIVLRIIDAPQSYNGESFDVLADDTTGELVVTDTHDYETLGENIAAGIQQLREQLWCATGGTLQDLPLLDANVTVIDPATVPICPSVGRVTPWKPR